MNNIAIAHQTIKITGEKKYEFDGREILLPDIDYKNVEVISPEKGAEFLKEDISKYFVGDGCRYSVVNEDSFQAASRYEKPFVMNFANAHEAGGGFIFGARAQEEALCRCSTLYASLKSEKASEMYRYNNSHFTTTESDYMLYSPDVCVFRNEKCELIAEYFMASVITVPAPNRNGLGFFAPLDEIKKIMERRTKIMLTVAAKHGHKNLVLGAWGCGAFGNKPSYVAEIFRKVLADDMYGKCFDEVCFAVYGSPDGRNISVFRKIFS